jgi:hypothetical protein
VDLVHTRRRRNHLRQVGPEGAKAQMTAGGMSGKHVALSPLNMRLTVTDFAL